MRWVVRAGILPAGRVASAPGRIGELLGTGVLSDALVEHTAVWLWLQDGVSWAGIGAEVRSALSEALDCPDWIVEPAPGEVLSRVVADLLDGAAGEFVRSHGGTVTTERSGDTVAVRLGGACEHCPAAGLTLRQRLLGEVRARCPNLVELDSRAGALTLTLAPAPG